MEEGKIIDISENIGWISTEVICVKCLKRWLAMRPHKIWLKDIECPECGTGYVIETGQVLDEENQTDNTF